MKPLDHYRLAMYLQERKRLGKMLDVVNGKIERVQYQPCAKQPLGQRILKWWFA